MSPAEPPARTQIPSGETGSRRLLPAVALATAAFTVAFLALFLIPGWVVRPDAIPDAPKRLELQNQVRTTLLQAIGGIVLVWGAYATWRQLQLGRRQFDHSLESNTAQLRLAQERQITEQFGKAVEQLGHDTPRVRVGALYALEQLAKTAPTVRAATYELLTAFIRAGSPWLTHDPDSLTAIDPNPEPEHTSPATQLLLNIRKPDIQAAIAVLARRTPAENEAIDLQGVDLAGAYLIRAKLARSDFGRSMLAWAVLDDADLSNANLSRVSLYRAHLWNTDLTGATLLHTDLRKADLRGADLSRTNLANANLTGATCDAATRWPEDFDPLAAGIDPLA